ncbi:hypothetical protein [Chryseobacterium sp. Leaf394]|uniref:hypothetical protein n=1 Tax=Chryseobacterium sp. Leaf394 TaxID=1736361 RepID=UPI0006F2ADCA|nr:hypothetical protein [Chryseobacterium sp. Leaf394]KQS95203.1 hypothetical protein ASG21_17335 [Chryseobacterium sp. Leaf394]
MKTPNKSPFSVLANEFLENTLDQLVHDYSIVQIFYKQEKNSKKSHLLISVSKNADAVKLQSKKWVAEVREQYQVYIYFIDYSRLKYQFSKGHPFIEYQCQQSSVIYQNEDSRYSLLRHRLWKKYRKLFCRYEDLFHHDHEIRRVQLERLIAEDSCNSVFTTFEELIEYDLEYLEDLYTGSRMSDIDLNQRINNLIIYIPELKSCFVRKNQQEYFITELFYKAKKAIEEGDIIYDTEMFASLRNIEDSLFTFIEGRFHELKHLIKKQYEKICNAEQNVILPEEYPKDEILDLAINKILTFTEPEQIYSFHKTVYGEITTFYLLLIGKNLNNEKLKSINQSLKSMSGDQYGFLILGHDRYWIQKNLYQYQNFFSYIMQAKYLVYSSDQFHPELHWQMPYHPQHNDLYFHYKITLETALQLNRLLDSGTEIYQGLPNIFSLFFLSFCRSYIFVKTYYLPNYLTSEALWKLCIYADKDIYRHNHLFEQFFTNIFPYIDYNMKVHHQLTKINKEKADQMKMIVEKLMNELRESVIGSKLLDDFETNYNH